VVLYFGQPIVSVPARTTCSRRTWVTALARESHSSPEVVTPIAAATAPICTRWEKFIIESLLWQEFITGDSIS
jgi:hypothetical protein